MKKQFINTGNRYRLLTCCCIKTLTTLTTVMLLFASPAIAQTWGEWFNQKSTQRKYLIQQIAALKVYTEFLRKGYTVVKDGTGLIRDIKNGDFNLHKDYFGGLKTVNPAIKQYDKVDDIIAMHALMLQERQATLATAADSKRFSNEEIRALLKLYAALSDEAGKDLDELLMVVENGTLELSDDERIKRIEQLYARMQGKLSFQRKLNNNIVAISSGRKRQSEDNEIMKAIMGI
ncbi:hypothetical protein [Pedobacter steynii]|uniref:TerB family tellurite resistance protein n=1 Tax=Pedobacter steynii TaxID=430522 RepID=A0A1D7QN26_9SPHI|nr:hypothetical protein [Pedobacter steynii]AOM80070.1 hypothetical protein BFS30_24645 [Pedobacter steynii]